MECEVVVGRVAEERVEFDVTIQPQEDGGLISPVAKRIAKEIAAAELGGGAGGANDGLSPGVAGDDRVSDNRT